MHKMIREPLVYVQRPDGTSLWLTKEVAHAMNVAYGTRLTTEQMEHPNLRGLLERCRRYHALKGGKAP